MSSLDDFQNHQDNTSTTSEDGSYDYSDWFATRDETKGALRTIFVTILMSILIVMSIIFLVWYLKLKFQANSEEVNGTETKEDEASDLERRKEAVRKAMTIKLVVEDGLNDDATISPSDDTDATLSLDKCDHEYCTADGPSESPPSVVAYTYTCSRMNSKMCTTKSLDKNGIHCNICASATEKGQENQMKDCISGNIQTIVLSSLIRHEQDCCICLCPFQVGDRAAWSRKATEKQSCRHVFHGECIERWLMVQNQNKCPVCRRSYFGDDGETELEENGVRDENGMVDLESGRMGGLRILNRHGFVSRRAPDTLDV